MARMLVEEGFDHSVTATTKVHRHVNFAEDARAGIEKLERMLHPSIASKYRKEFDAKGEDFYFHKELAFDALKAHKQFWR